MHRFTTFAFGFVLAFTTAVAAPAFAAEGDGSSGGGLQIGELVPFGTAQLLVPFGDLGDVGGVGIGVSGGVLADLNDRLTGRAEFGILKPSGEDFAGFSNSIWMFPLSALIEFAPDPANPFYISGGLTLAFLRFSSEGEVTVWNGFQFVTETQDFSDTETKIGLTAGGGYEVDENIAVEGKLHLIEHGSMLTLGARMTF